MQRNDYAAAVVSYVINRVAERIHGTRVSTCLSGASGVQPIASRGSFPSKIID